MKKSDSEYLLTFEGIIESEWHMYSQFTRMEVLPLEVLFPNSKNNFEPAGKTKESETITEFNDVFKVDETFLKKSTITTAYQNYESKK